MRTQQQLAPGMPMNLGLIESMTRTEDWPDWEGELKTYFTAITVHEYYGLVHRGPDDLRHRPFIRSIIAPHPKKLETFLQQHALVQEMSL